MFLKKLIYLCLLFISIFFLSLQNVSACSCGQKPTVLDSFESADLVVTAKIVSVKKSKEIIVNTDDSNVIESSKLVVEKVYKGDIKVGKEIILGQGSGSDCIFVFKENWIGDKMLLYLGKPTKGHPYFSQDEDKNIEPMYYVSFCGRSNGLEAATDDLLYLDNLDKVRGKTRVSGKLDVWFSEGPNFSNIEVKIIGKNKTYTTKTDKNGVYEIYDLPAGQYLIEPQVSKGWKISEYMLQHTASYPYPYGEKPLESKYRAPFILQPNKHAGMDLLYEIDNAIRGKILSPMGMPMKGVCVKAVSTELKEGDYRGRSDCTNEKGEYEINEVSPGNYILVANDDGKIDGDEPFGVVFYPGVSEFNKAGVVSIKIGQFLDDVSIQIPQIAELIQVTGKLLYSDGKPVSKEYVEFNPTETEKFDESRTKTDEQGNFSIKIPKGADGKLFSEDYVYASQFKDCINRKEIIQNTGKDSKDIKTNEINVNAETDLFNVKLIFPFPSCKKSN